MCCDVRRGQGAVPAVHDRRPIRMRNSLSSMNVSASLNSASLARAVLSNSSRRSPTCNEIRDEVAGSGEIGGDQHIGVNDQPIVGYRSLVRDPDRGHSR